MLRAFTCVFLCIFYFSYQLKAQRVDEIYVNLYTDSLKKGTYNYINIDGKMSNGTYLPLDSNYLIFKSSYGEFFGNSLYIPDKCEVKKVDISVILKRNPEMHREFSIWIKQSEDGPLPTSSQIIDQMREDRNRNRHNK